MYEWSGEEKCMKYFDSREEEEIRRERARYRRIIEMFTVIRSSSRSPFFLRFKHKTMTAQTLRYFNLACSPIVASFNQTIQNKLFLLQFVAET